MLAAPEVPQDADGRIGLLGISFAGGLSVIAAGRPSLRDRVGFVFSVGGHARLPGVMQYLCTGRQPDGRMHPPHEYGAVILLTNMAEDVVPADQVAPLRAAVHQFLHASHVDMFDKRAGRHRVRHAPAPWRRRCRRRRAPSCTWSTTRDALGLGARLLPFLDRWGTEAALSPGDVAGPARARSS